MKCPNCKHALRRFRPWLWCPECGSLVHQQRDPRIPRRQLPVYEDEGEHYVVMPISPGTVVNIEGIPFHVSGEAYIGGHESNFQIPEVKKKINGDG